MKNPTTPREMIAHLQRENAALRQALADMPTCRCGLSTDEQCALSVENAALLADKKRLDWLDSVGCWLTIPGYTKNNVWCWGASREVIDLARKEAQP